MRGSKMISFYACLFVSFIFLVIAIYSNRSGGDNEAKDPVEQKLNDLSARQDATSRLVVDALSKIEDMKRKLDIDAAFIGDYSISMDDRIHRALTHFVDANTASKIKHLHDEIEILKIRQRTLDRKLTSRQSMDIRITKDSEPVQVKVAPNIKGSGKEALLRKAGINGTPAAR